MERPPVRCLASFNFFSSTSHNAVNSAPEIFDAIFFAGQIATNGYFSKKVEPLKLVVMQMFVAGILFVINIFSGIEKFLSQISKALFHEI